VPYVDRSSFKGYRIARQGYSEWKDAYDTRMDPQGRPYYWLSGEFVTIQEHADADDLLVAEGWAAITPIHYELTNFAYLERLQAHPVVAEICASNR